MIKGISIKVRNYKCFGVDPQGFEKIYPINIIIGKNNTGKSSLIDLIEYVVNPTDSFIKVGHNKIDSQVLITDVLSKDSVGDVPKNISSGGIFGSYYDYALSLTEQKIIYSLGSDGVKSIIEWTNSPKKELDTYIKSILSKQKKPFQFFSFKRINAERDIKTEGSDYTKILVASNGDGATNVIKQIVSQAKHDTDLIKKRLLTELNKIVNPDIIFTDIHPQEISNGVWEIYLEDSEKGLIALSKMGSGIKTILLVLLDLVVIPEFESKQKDKLIFGFEELENNLHPSMQRRMFNYIADYAESNGTIFFITTHSSIVIDLFKSRKNSQIVHVQSKGKNSIVNAVINRNDGVSVLKDLDFKASDLLLSNGIVWVEGPSDVIYLELLLALFFKSRILENKFDYSIQCLSTAVWKHAGFVDFNWEEISLEAQNKIITLAKLNHNHLLVIDKDDDYEDKKPSEWESFSNGTGKNKAKLIHESMIFSGHKEAELTENSGNSSSGGMFFWINDGTFETYLEYFIGNKGKSEFEKFFDLKKQRTYFEKKRNGPDSSKSKVELASEIAKYSFDNDLSLEDIAPLGSPLHDKLERLYTTLRQWN